MEVLNIKSFIENEIESCWNHAVEELIRRNRHMSVIGDAYWDEKCKSVSDNIIESEGGWVW